MSALPSKRQQIAGKDSGVGAYSVEFAAMQFYTTEHSTYVKQAGG